MNRLRIIREKKGLTLEEVSKTLDISHMTLQRYETGARQVTLKKLEVLADYYDVNVAELVTDDFNAQINTTLLKEVVSYALARSKNESLNEETLAKVISITYMRCQAQGDDERSEKIKEKVDDMLTCAI